MKTTNIRTHRMVQLALFTAIIFLLAFTPLGYINTMGLSITLLGIPVIVGAIVFGPTFGAILGGVFGITSFIRCFGFEAFGIQLLAINPVTTFIVCMVPRILFGWLAGIIFKALKKNDRMKSLSYAVTSFASSLIHTILFMTFLILFFYHTEFIQTVAAGVGAKNVFAFFIAIAGLNGTVEAVVCLILGTAIAKTIDIYSKKSGL
ncbi:MAG TPA: ECF transporter S component [Mobilitalea sp.]|nr:ECF transporter S component [Mobilitalea sp.]